MKIQPPDDDVRLQKLNTPSSARGAESRPVEQTGPVHRAMVVNDARERIARAPDDRRQSNRRQGERRKQQQSTLLDTRSGHERRGQGRRGDDQQAEAANPEPHPTHIDVKT